jgi:L,D-peptidoglycan transpeptidase YkuD (ErfK/YbiS/YcfS/YnhG family)
MIKRVAVFLVVLTLAAYGSSEALASGLPEEVLSELSKTGIRQVVLVVNDERPNIPATVHALEEEAPGKWRDVFGPIDATIGKKGFAPPGKKRAGDGRSPSGVYELRRAFGYSPVECKIDYIHVTKEDIWVDDSESPYYNKIVKRKGIKASSFEEMKRDDHLYKYGIIIEYNTDPPVKRRGSAIFFHLWRAPASPTRGCVAMSEENILKLISWLDPLKKPRVVMGTRADMVRLIENIH